jgi:DDB1- and CUL4-associated factor 8
MLRELYGRELGASIRLQNPYTAAFTAQFSKVGGSLQHNGCVNTLRFNRSGSHIMTGSDDRCVKIWDVEKAVSGDNVGRGHHLTHTIRTAHRSNIFCADFCPFNENLVLSVAADGRVLLNDIACGSSNGARSETLLLESDNMLHMFQFDIEQPQVVYTAEECGHISRIDLRVKVPEVVFRTGSVGVKAVLQADALGPSTLIAGLASSLQVGTIDLRYRQTEGDFIKMWAPHFPYPLFYGDYVINGNAPVYPTFPMASCGRHNFGVQASVSGLALSKDSSKLLVSYQSDQIYTYRVQSQHEKEGPLQCFGGHINHATFLKTVSFYGDNDEYVVSGSDGGQAWVFDAKNSGYLGSDDRRCDAMAIFEAGKKDCVLLAACCLLLAA